MKRKIIHICYRFSITVCAAGCLLLFPTLVKAQDTTSKSNLVPIEDLRDFARRILHKKVDSAKAEKPKKLAILPSVGYNPSLGVLIGAKISGVKQLGSSENTMLSSFGMEAVLTSKGVITLQARHNIFRADNKWNIQRQIQIKRVLLWIK